MYFASPAPVPAYAGTPATVSLTGEYVRIGGTVQVTVTDTGVSTTATHTAKATGKFAYFLPVGSTGDNFVFQTTNALLTDKNGDGVVSELDLSISITDAIPISIVPSNGAFTLRLTQNVTSPIPFTVTYSAEKIDQLTVKVTSSSDTTGFNLTLEETTAVSGVFTGTFETGAATVTTNSTAPAATERPDIKAVHGNLVTVAYTDTEPLSIVNDTILVDGIAPTVSQISPAHHVFEQTLSSFFEATVTDIDSGVDISSIRFHYDNDGNNTFTEPGTIVLLDPSMTTMISTGLIVRFRVPTIAADGLRTWYVTASDNAGGAGRSDAVEGTAGNQVHVFTSDQNPPRVASAVAGEWYDTVSKTIKSGNRTSIRVTFNEIISVPSLIASGFRIAGVPAASTLTHAALPNDVFLTVESFPTVGPVILMIDPGSITDLSGIQTSRVPITVTDKVPPLLSITFDRPVTNTLVKINVKSDEVLAAPPAITVNGLTRSVPTTISQREWELVFNVVSLKGADAGQGVKTVGAFGFDTSNTMGTATQATFQVDTTVVVPVLTPTGAVQMLESSPVITASYSTEADEYVGDTHLGMSLILATLDRVPVSPLMNTVDSGVTWTLKTIDVQPDGLANGVHIFQIMAEDAAGNSHEMAATVFEVFVDPTVPEPVVEPTPVENTDTTPPVEEDLPVVESPDDTGVPEVSEPSEPIRDPLFDRVAEQVGTDAGGAGSTSGSSAENTFSSIVEEGDGTVFGCNLPLGNSNVVGGEYALLGVGLLGLGLRRPAGALRDLLWPAGMGPSPGTWTSPANAPVTARMPDRVHRPKSSRGR